MPRVAPTIARPERTCRVEFSVGCALERNAYYWVVFEAGWSNPPSAGELRINYRPWSHGYLTLLCANGRPTDNTTWQKALFGNWYHDDEPETSLPGLVVELTLVEEVGGDAVER